MSTNKRIAKNTTLLFASQLITLLLGFFATLYAARYLGVEGFGILSLAISLGAIIAVIADLGLNSLTVREVAKNKTLANKYIINTFLIRFFLALISFLFIILLTNLTKYPSSICSVIYIITAANVIGSFSLAFSSIFQAYEKMEYQSITNIINSFIILTGFLIVISFKGSLILFAIIYLIANIVALFYSFILCTWKFVNLKFEIDLKFCRKIFRESVPFGLISIFAIIYVWADTFLLSVLQGNEAVGIYNAAYRLIFYLQIIPGALNMAIFPVISKLYVTSNDKLNFTIQKYFKIMILISIPMGVIISLQADKIVLLLFGTAYYGSILALQILIWSAVFVFIYSPFVQLLFSINKQIIITKITAVCMFINIFLNLVLIPKFSYIASSWITVITEFIILMTILFITSKLYFEISRENIGYCIRVIFASGLIAIFISIFINQNLFLIIITSILIYLGILFIIKGINKDDLNLLKSLLKD